MPMGSAGMGEMGSMEMPLPDNTLPMMTGFAQFGPVEMGGMFWVVKVRPDSAADDYKDPGWYRHPEGTVAYEWTGEKLAEPTRATPPGSCAKAAEFRAVDPRKRRFAPGAATTTTEPNRTDQKEHSMKIRYPLRWAPRRRWHCRPDSRSPDLAGRPQPPSFAAGEPAIRKSLSPARSTWS